MKDCDTLMDAIEQSYKTLENLRGRDKCKYIYVAVPPKYYKLFIDLAAAARHGERSEGAAGPVGPVAGVGQMQVP